MYRPSTKLMSHWEGGVKNFRSSTPLNVSKTAANDIHEVCDSSTAIFIGIRNILPYTGIVEKYISGVVERLESQSGICNFLNTV